MSLLSSLLKNIQFSKNPVTVLPTCHSFVVLWLEAHKGLYFLRLSLEGTLDHGEGSCIFCPSFIMSLASIDKSCHHCLATKCVQLFPDPMDYRPARLLLLMGFPRQEYWSGLPFLSPGDLPDPGIKPGSPALQADCLLTELLGT